MRIAAVNWLRSRFLETGVTCIVDRVGRAGVPSRDRYGPGEGSGGEEEGGRVKGREGTSQETYAADCERATASGRTGGRLIIARVHVHEYARTSSKRGSKLGRVGGR